MTKIAEKIMRARKEYKERVCKEEGCKRIFFPKHHQQTRCSDECRAKAVKDKNQRQDQTKKQTLDPYFRRTSCIPA